MATRTVRGAAPEDLDTSPVDEPPAAIAVVARPVVESAPAPVPQQMVVADPASIYTRPPKDGQLLGLSVDDLVPNPFNPRTDPGDLSDLDSITTSGIISALAATTRKNFLEQFPEADGKLEGTGKYVIIAGWRRWTRAKQEGFEPLPTVIHTKKTRRQLRQMMVQENLGRTNLNPIDEAQAYVDYQADFKVSANQAADELGVPRSRVSKRVALLKLPDEAKQLVIAGTLGPEIAYRLKAAGDRILEAWQLVVDREYSPEAAVKALTAPPQPDPSGAGSDADRVATTPTADTSISEAAPAPRLPAPSGSADTAEGESQPAQGSAVESPVLTPEERAMARRDACRFSVASKRVPLVEMAAAMTRLLFTQASVPTDADAKALAAGWLGYDPFAPSTVRQWADAGFAMTLAVAEARAVQHEGAWDGLDGRYFDLINRHGGYRPSAEELAAIEEAM